MAFWAEMESQIAGAQARQCIAQSRIDEADAEGLSAVIREMEYKTQAAQVRQLTAEEKTRRALARALRAEQEAIAAARGVNSGKAGCSECAAPSADTGSY